jgi:hypothetical protein
MNNGRLSQQQFKNGSLGKTAQGHVHWKARQIVSNNAYRGAMRPFFRFVNLIYREFGHIETMTLEKMDAIETTCIKLCDDERIGLLRQKRKQKELHKKH